MSKDMRDWPRANLGVAASMFNHQKYGSWGFAIQNRDVATPAGGWPAGLSQLIVSGTCHFLCYIINVWVRNGSNNQKFQKKEGQLIIILYHYIYIYKILIITIYISIVEKDVLPAHIHPAPRQGVPIIVRSARESSRDLTGLNGINHQPS